MATALRTIILFASSTVACSGPPDTFQEQCVAAMTELEGCGILSDPAGQGYDEGCERMEESGTCDPEVPALWRCLDADDACCPAIPGGCCSEQMDAFIQCTSSR